MTPFQQSIVADFDAIQLRIKSASGSDADAYFNSMMFIVSASLGCVCGVLTAVEHKTALEAFDFITGTLRDRIARNPTATYGESTVALKRKLN